MYLLEVSEDCLAIPESPKRALIDEYCREIGSMHSSAYRFAVRLWNHQEYRMIVIEKLSDLHLTSGSFCGGGNMIRSQIQIWCKALHDVFSIHHSNEWHWNCECEKDAQFINRISGEKCCFQDAIALSCGRAFDIISGDAQDVGPVDCIWASILCNGVSSSNIHFSEAATCIDDVKNGTGETFWYLHNLVKNPAILNKLKLLLAENGKHFESKSASRSCMDAADEYMAQLGLSSLNSSFDCRSYRSGQSRPRVHLCYSHERSHRRRDIYEGVLNHLAEGELPLQQFIKPYSEARNDWWLNKKLNKVSREDTGAVLGMAELEATCKQNKAWPIPKHKDPYLPDQFGLPEGTVMWHVDTQSLKAREAAIIYTKLVAHKLIRRISGTDILVMSVDRSLKHWRDNINMIGTIDPNAKLYIVTIAAGEECIRPLSVAELLSLQGARLNEHFSPKAQGQLKQTLPHRSLCRAIGHMYHFGTELAHYIAAVAANDRLKP